MKGAQGIVGGGNSAGYEMIIQERMMGSV